jgi:hypothetical protein
MTLERLFATWLALAVAMTLNGAFREGFLRQWMSGPAADVTSAFLGAVIILAISRAGFRRFVTATDAALVQSALILVTLTVIFEFAIGRLMDGKSWSALLAHYAFWRGELWTYLLLLLAATPFIWGRWLTSERRHAH